MGENGNGNKFIRGIFWTLILASFGWATTVLILNASALSAHCRDAEAKTTDLKAEMIARDEIMIKEMTQEFKLINNSLTELKTDIKYLRKENSH